MKKGFFRKKTLNEVIVHQASKKRVVRRIERSRAIKKPKNNTIKRLKNKLWELCKQIIRLKYGNTCYTCGKSGLTGSSWQTGHFIPSSVGGASLRYNLDNLRIQCYFCNCNAGGNGAIYYKKLVEIDGQEYVDELFRCKNIIIKADEIWFKSKIEEYEKILCEMKKVDL